MIVTRMPRSTRSRPSDAAAMPLPSEETTPPVMKMYRVCCELPCIRQRSRHKGIPSRVGALKVFLGVNAGCRCFPGDRHPNGQSGGQRPELLQALDFFEWMRRKRNPFAQSVARIGVDSNML